jgi:hypothetical protein
MAYLSDEEVFGGGGSNYLSDSEVFGAPARPAQTPVAAEPVTAAASPEEIGYDALGNVTGSAPAPVSDSGGNVAKELRQLRDEVFTGVEQGIAGVKTVNAVGQINRLDNTKKRLSELEAAGRGDSMAARNMRGEIASLEERLPRNIGEMTEAQANFQRGAQMTTRPAVAKLGKAKTFDEAWSAFTESPYDVIAGVTATSLPTSLPALVAGAVLGPAAGAVTMGGGSAITEAGSSLADFAQEAGVDTTNAAAVQKFFTNPKNLSDALAYAGKRAGIIGTMDAASGGLASKTLAPKALTNVAARQAVNLPTQMTAQAAAGGAGEAGAQIATKGKVDQWGQVISEMAGEFGGAPADVAAFGRDVATARATEPAKPNIVETHWGAVAEPVAAIATAPTVDAAIAAAEAAVETPATPREIVDASEPTAVPGVAATGGVDGRTDPASGVAAVLGTDNVAGSALDTGSAGNQPAAVAGELGAAGGVSVNVADPQVRAMAERIAQLEAQQAPAAPVATLTPGGMLNVQGEPKPLLKFLKDNGITSAIPSATGVTVGRSQAAQAQALLQDFAPAPTMEASQGATNEQPSGNIAEQQIPAIGPFQSGERAPVQNNVGGGAAGIGADPGGSRQDARGDSGGAESRSKSEAMLRRADAPDSGQVNAAKPTQPRSEGAPGRTSRGNVEPVGASERAGATADVARTAAPVATAARADVAGRAAAQDGARSVPSREQVGGRAVDGAAVLGLAEQPRGNGRDALRPEGRDDDDQQAAPVADRAPTERERVEAQRPKNQKEVSRFNGKYGKGMSRDAAKLEAARLNRQNDNPDVTYAAEEHGDAKLENPYAVVGREKFKPRAAPAAPKLTERERIAEDRKNSPAGRREAEAARAQEPAKPKFAFIDGGLSPRSTQQVVDSFREFGMELQVADTVDDLPAVGQKRVKSEGLEGVVRGMYDSQTDKAWIVRENIAEMEEAFFVGMHEAFHRGLLRTFGDEVKPILNYLELNNKTLRDKARDYAKEHSISRLEAIEEVLADMAGEGNATSLKGWDRLLAFLKEAISKVAKGLGVNIPITDAMIEQFVAGIRREGMAERVFLETGEAPADAPKLSRAPATNVLDALSEQDQLFKLPKSSAMTIEEIAADNMPGVDVKVTRGPLTTIYNLTMPDGAVAKIYVRQTNPYGEQAYGMIDRGNGDMEAVFERPGTNPEDVPAETESVYTDVSRLKEGGAGAAVYNIAATFAHNTDRIFIGDPAGLSDTAMRRRTEQMLSSALKFGTTRHLAPHPRQVEGDKALGVPAMRWTYGDDLGNIESLVKTSLASLENAGGNPLTFDPETGRFLDDAGEELSRADIQALADAGMGREARAGSSTLQRDAILRALSEPVGGAAARSGGSGAVADERADARAGDGRQDSQERAGRAASEGESGEAAVLRKGGKARANGVGLLERLLALAGEPDSPARGVFYSRKPVGESKRGDGTPPAQSGEAADKPNIWNAPEATKTDRVIFELQDGRIDLKRAQQAIRESGREIEEKFDARMAETLYPGRVAHRNQQFLEIEVRPLLESMSVNKVAMDELSDYLLARHAPERNAQIAKVNPDLQDGGAGSNSKGELMTTAAAKKYIANLDPMQRKKLEAVAAKVDAITAGTRSILVNEGLEKPETVQAWEGAYKFYAPLFKDEGEAGVPHPQGSGFSVKGSSSKRATGSTKQVTDVLAHVLMQREAAMTRAEKNRVAMSLYGLVLSNPNPDFWTTIRPGMSPAEITGQLRAMGIDPGEAEAAMQGVPTIRTVDPVTEKVVDRPNPMYKNLPTAITLKVAGEDRVILLNAENERARRLAESLKNLDGLTKLDIAGNIVGRATRWIASVNTQYNPVFGLVNVIRDTLGGTVNLTSTDLKTQKAKILGNVPAALIGIARDLRGDAKRTEWSDLFNQFQEAGGQTGYRELFRDAGDRTKAIEKELKQAERDGKLTPGKAAHAVLDLLDDFNTALENAVRLSAFKAGLDQGMSKPAAARVARELTVDFNRKGRAGREVGPLYAFFNASVQGSARTIETLKGPAGVKIIAGGFALGALQALMLAAAGYDDDEIPEFIKSRNLIIPTGWRSKEKRFIAIPYPLGLHVLPNTGRTVTELTLSGGKDLGKRSVSAIGEIMGAFNPLGGGNVLTLDGALKTAAPTVVDPFIEMGFNRNFAGNPIEKKPFNEEGDNRPGFQRARESTHRSLTGQAYLAISKAINSMTGGNDFEAGAASPTPERVRYIAQTVGGGVLREFEKSVNAAANVVQGQPVKQSAIPLTGRFYGEVDSDQVEMSRYYEASNRIRKVMSSYKAAEKAGNAAEANRIARENPEVMQYDDLKAVQKNVSALNKLAVETVNNPAQMAKIDAQRAAEMKVLNDLVRKMEKREPKLADKLREATTF